MENYNELFTNIATGGLVAMMFAMGLGLAPADFARVLRAPTAAIIGLAGQIVVLPIVAILIILILQPSPYVAVGIMIIAACPGGATSNAFSFMAKGDVALSISLTAISGMLAFISTPVIVSIGASMFGQGDAKVELSFIDTSLRVLLTTALPASLGMAARAFISLKWDKLVPWIFGAGLIAVLGPSARIIYNNSETMLNQLGSSAVGGLALNISMMAIGFGMAALARLPETQRRTISIEIGIQNFALAVVIIMSILQDPRFLVPGLFYLPAMYLTGGAMIFLSRRADARNLANA